MLDARDPADTLIMNLADVVPKPIGPYNLRREIGRGGMSVVYEAQDTRTGQEIALKLLTLPPSLTAEDAGDLVARFKREARTAASLSHPNVIRIHEIGVHQGRHFLAMEYLRGQTLRARMNEGALTSSEALPVLTQIAEALDAVHKAGIVHRDVKPTNVMLLPDGTAKLLDFGIAQSRDETTITHAGIIIGSPSYMAPEQVKGEIGTAATDLWALGVLSYELLAGHLPFAGQSVGSVLYQIMHQSPADTPGLPTAVQKVLRRALDKRPAERYPTANALVQALRSVLTEPKPASPRPRSSASHPRSTPRWLPGAMLAFLFLLGFSGTVLKRHHSSSAARKEAVSQSSAQTFIAPHVSEAPLPTAPPALPPAAIVSALPGVQAASRRHQVVSRNDLALPLFSSPPTVQAKQPDAPLKLTPKRSIPSKPISSKPIPSKPILAAQTAVLPVRPHRTATAFKKPAALRIPVQTVVRHASAQTAAQQMPVLTAVPNTPPLNTDRPVTVQSAPQGITLSYGGSSYDPEAEARHRKLAWSQNGSPSTP